LTSSKFMESLVGARSDALHRRLMQEFGWSEDLASDFLTRVGLGLLGGLRNNSDVDIARLHEEAELFTLVTTLDFRAITTHLAIEAGDAWRGARWAALAVIDTLQSRRRDGTMRLAGVGRPA